jgi:hypothetical protein
MHDRGRPDGGVNSKVARIIEEYELDKLGEELERRWIAEDGDSLRDLADVFNRRLLEATLVSSSGSDAFDPESVYVALTDDDVPAGERRTIKRNLERAGVDVEQLIDGFVSH